MSHPKPPAETHDPLLAAWKARCAGCRSELAVRLAGINARLDELAGQPTPSARFLVHAASSVDAAASRTE